MLVNLIIKLVKLILRQKYLLPSIKISVYQFLHTIFAVIKLIFINLVLLKKYT